MSRRVGGPPAGVAPGGDVGQAVAGGAAILRLSIPETCSTLPVFMLAVSTGTTAVGGADDEEW
jgi:hypothetical protein